MNEIYRILDHRVRQFFSGLGYVFRICVFIGLVLGGTIGFLVTSTLSPYINQIIQKFGEYRQNENSSVVISSYAQRESFANIRLDPYIEPAVDQQIIETSIIHLVRRTDTIFQLAEDYHADWKHIAEINNLRPPYRLEAGQKLIIPYKSTHK
jgi:LysM repeat protein